MPPFSSRPLTVSRLNRSIKRNPALFGVPFILLMVAASYGLTSFTQIRYDLQDHKVKQVTKEQELGIDRNRKKFDIREEYFVSHFSSLSLSLISILSRVFLGFV